MDTIPNDELSLLHFNDVYHITQSTALGRLSHAFRTAKSLPEADRPTIVFSGDAFSPSLESAVLKGEHMIPVLNHLSVDVACYGNHDFDFGEDVLVGLSKRCTFPWLLANAVHADGRLLASAKEYLVLEKKGYRIGFFGLAGTDWPSNCQNLPADCTVLDPVRVAHRISAHLRATHAVDVVIALTHMRHEEDVGLASSCDDVDLILGGHDHDLIVHGIDLTADGVTFEGDVQLVKSGTDFKSFSDIRMGLVRDGDGKARVAYIRVHQTRDLTSEEDRPLDARMRGVLADVQTRIATKVDKPLFFSTVDLDGRTSVVRTRETNLGNMVADAVRAYYDADIALINSGSLRCDRVIEAGVITVKDMIDIVPFGNPFVVKRLRGQAIAEALENAACDIVDGRFVQVSGITFRIDPRRPVGARVHGVSLARGHASSGRALVPAAATATATATATAAVAGETPLRANDTYTVAMVAFIARGFDGYGLFRDAPTVVDEEGAVTDTSLFVQLFRRDAITLGAAESDSEVHMERARDAIVLGTTEDGLPSVGPCVQGRIQVQGTAAVPLPDMISIDAPTSRAFKIHSG